MTYKYWNSGNDVAIFRVGDGISLQDFKHILTTFYFRKYMVVERLNFRLNGQVYSKKHKSSRKTQKKLLCGSTPLQNLCW
jgi:hypothetical protein